MKIGKSGTIEFVKSSASGDDLIDDGAAEVAFVGRSNVGKSSLLNRLVGEKVARTSSTPGRTQTVNWFCVDGSWWLVDLPGFGWARASKTARAAWGEVVDAFFERRSGKRLVVQLVDSRVGATVLDVEAARWFDGLAEERIVAATKVDKLKRGERARALAEIGDAVGRGAELLAVSAVTGEGVRELWKRITDFRSAG